MAQDPLLQAFAALARRCPGAPLVVSPRRAATVAEVDGLARAIGALLDERPGRTPGEVVALAAPNGPGFLAALLALRRAGLAALLLDAGAPAAEALRVARALGASALLRSAEAWPRSAAGWALTETAVAAPLSPPGIAVVKATSGSTGTPRGIATPVEALLADEAALTATMGLRPDDRLLAAVPLSHSYGLSSLAVPALVRGTVLVVPEGESLLDPFAAAAAAGATFFPTVPAYVQALLRLSERPALPPLLRLVISAGAPLAPEAARGFREAFGLPVHAFYGASECGGICYDREGGAAERGTVGTPVEGVSVILAPLCDQEEERAAETGVVTVASPAVAAGYLPEPEPRLGGGRFTTSDLAAWQGSELALRGRLDDLINVKGKKVDPREVERVLGELPGVEEAAVVGVALPERGGEMVRAVVACRPGRLTAEQVLAWCREHLAAHKVPRSVVLVERIPRTERGKLDRAALRG